MKKNIGLILLVLIFTTGCGCTLHFYVNKKPTVLSCYGEEVKKEYTTNTTILWYFNEKTNFLESYTQKMTIDYGSNTDLASKKYQDFLDLCGEIGNFSGVSCSGNKIEENKVVIELNVILSELEEGNIFGEDLKDKYVSFETVKDKMRNFNPPMTCEES